MCSTKTCHCNKQTRIVCGSKSILTYLVESLCLVMSWKVQENYEGMSHYSDAMRTRHFNSTKIFHTLRTILHIQCSFTVQGLKNSIHTNKWPSIVEICHRVNALFQVEQFLKIAFRSYFVPNEIVILCFCWYYF